MPEERRRSLNSPSDTLSIGCLNDNRFVATRRAPPRLSIHDLRTGQEIAGARLEPGFHDYQVSAISRSGRLVLVGLTAFGGLKGCSVVDLTDPSTPSVKHFRDQPINSRGYGATFSTDGRFAALCGDGQIVEIWDTTTLGRVAALDGHGSPVLTVAFSPDGKTLASGDAEGFVKLWNVTTWRELFTLAELGHPVPCLRFSPDGRTLAATSDPVKSEGSSELVLWRTRSSPESGADASLWTSVDGAK